MWQLLEGGKALYNTEASLKMHFNSKACELIQCKEGQYRVLLISGIFLCISLSCPQDT